MAAIVTIVSGATACTYRVDWPEGPARMEEDPDGAAVRAFAVGGRTVNYWQRMEGGRVVELRFDDNGDGRPDETIDIHQTHPEWPHCVIILDGVPFEVARNLHEEGRFRLFSPPARLVSVFPAMTDLALSRILRTDPCAGIEAQYFDRARNAVTRGNDVYLSGGNAPWIPSVQYAAPQGLAVNTYLDPPAVFYEELRSMHRLFDHSDAGRAIAYSVGSAGMGMRRGEAGIREYLAAVDRLVERVTYDRRGRVRFSILADHGQNCRPLERVSFRETLESAGYRLASSIRKPEDVVMISYGLVTCVALHTPRAPDVAAALIAHPAVDLAAFLDAQEPANVVVQSREGRACIRKRPGGFEYDMSEGDPLKLAEVVDSLRGAGHVSPDGVIDDRALFDATGAHAYPDPLHRLWDAFHGLVRNPADVYLSLAGDACHGSAFFHFFVKPVASTHGALDYSSTVTAFLSNYPNRPLPAALRVDDVLDWLDPHALEPLAAESMERLDTPPN